MEEEELEDCGFGCGDRATHWDYEWDAQLCDACCEEQNTRYGEIAIRCSYLVQRKEDEREPDRDPA